jgi:hypothetical protein
MRLFVVASLLAVSSIAEAQPLQRFRGDAVRVADGAPAPSERSGGARRGAKNGALFGGGLGLALGLVASSLDGTASSNDQILVPLAGAAAGAVVGGIIGAGVGWLIPLERAPGGQPSTALSVSVRRGRGQARLSFRY